MPKVPVFVTAGPEEGGPQQGREPVDFVDISLTPSEERLFAFLSRVVAEKQLPVVLRVAGGWVRDKVLGRDNDDIDFALSGMYGREFVQAVVEYAVTSGDSVSIGTVAVIEAHAERSKHLETARVKIFDQFLDFVNLRSETYASDSRVPSIRIGTPLEDAERRDLTLNALFYNLSARAIEDLTGTGLRDLRARVARTPLSSRETFLDDPLRVLRTVRFAARFALQLTDDIVASARDPLVLERMATIISRERVGHELSGALLSPDPARALALVRDLGIWPCVLKTPIPDNLDAICTALTSWRSVSAELASPDSHLSPIDRADLSPSGIPRPLSPDAVVGLYLACALLPLAGASHVVAKPAKNKNSQAPKPRTVFLVTEVVLDTLKLSSGVASAVLTIQTVAQLLLKLGTELAGGRAIPRSRLARVVRSACSVELLRCAAAFGSVVLAPAEVQAACDAITASFPGPALAAVFRARSCFPVKAASERLCLTKEQRTLLSPLVAAMVDFEFDHCDLCLPSYSASQARARLEGWLDADPRALIAHCEAVYNTESS
jgi:hypothetical protein